MNVFVLYLVSQVVAVGSISRIFKGHTGLFTLRDENKYTGVAIWLNKHDDEYERESRFSIIHHLRVVLKSIARIYDVKWTKFLHHFALDARKC